MTGEEVLQELEVNRMERDQAVAKVEVLTARRRELFIAGHDAGLSWSVLGAAVEMTGNGVYRDVARHQ